MGYYIEVPENKGKAQQIAYLYGARMLDRQPNYSDAGPDEAIICVLDNGPFEAAGYAYSEDEFNEFAAPDFGYQRPRTWLIMGREKAEKLTGFSR